MKDIEILKMGKSYDNKLDKILILNQEIVSSLRRKKVINSLSSLLLTKGIILLFQGQRIFPIRT